MCVRQRVNGVRYVEAADDYDDNEDPTEEEWCASNRHRSILSDTGAADDNEDSSSEEEWCASKRHRSILSDTGAAVISGDD